MSNSRIGVVILHYNSAQACLRIVKDVAAQTVPATSVILVDNASSFEQVCTVRSGMASDVALVECPTNGGYGAGMNAGIENLGGSVDFFLLLTHDSRISPNFIEKMLPIFEREKLCAVAAPLLTWANDPSRVFSGGGVVEIRSGRTSHVSTPLTAIEWEQREPHAVDWVDGAITMVRAAALVKTENVFWEPFFLYFEEVDMQYRLKREGWEIWLNPSVVGSQQPGSLSPYLAFRNRILFSRRNMAEVPWRSVVVDALRNSVMWLRAGRPGGVFWTFYGLFDGFRGVSGPPPTRSRQRSWAPKG